MHDRLWVKSPLLILALGVGLFCFAVGHHTREFLVLNNQVGPLAALLLDGLPALGLAYAGYRLSGTALSPRNRWSVFLWCLSGGLVVMTVIGATFLIRVLEGRPLVEPVFPLLIAVEVGAIAGVVAGYYSARARADARRARTVSDALAFVNDLIRHDLRNDLTVIRGQANLVDTGGAAAGSETARGDPAVIAEKAGEALTRIETTRAVAETLTGAPDIEPVDLAATTADLAARVERASDVTVTTDLPDQALVRANTGLRSVVDNVIENAVEHNDADEPRVAVSVETDPETARLIVRDNGPGIPDDRTESLLAVNKTTGERGGLALVRTLVDAYDGDVWIEDNEPRGSVFVVTLPRADTALPRRE